MSDVLPFHLAGSRATGRDTLSVYSPWDGAEIARVSVPTPEQVERAVAALWAVRAEAQALPAHVRATALDHISARLTERAEEFAQLITAENGKPLSWARVEVERAASVFRWAAEEARRFSGQMQRLDTDPAGTGRLGYVRRFCRGPVLAIAPFNFPLNLVAHKVAPALAVGAPILIKPAPATPLSALLLGDLIAETNLPKGMVSVLPVPNQAMADLVADPRLPTISFTGSGPVGWAIQAQVPRKHVTLELGGNAAVIVDANWPDLPAAAERIALFGNYQAGQSCVSVQRVLVHADIQDEFLDLLLAAVERLRTGDPSAAGVQVGPVIDDAAADRIISWIDEAVAAGAQLRTGGSREGRTIAPTVLTDVPAGTMLADEEVFGPVLTVRGFADLDEAFSIVNDSRYGLQAGLFSTDLQVAFRAHRDLAVGGVVIGDVPSFRADQLPYGGWKDSGVGREGVLSAMHDLTEERSLILTGLEL
ncbi:MAG: aldehyde dehydrogenase family protein [Actinomycetota bacterium]|nr:aldehyde dehydrogenase family protein [Actinomycetota bacterium]